MTEVVDARVRVEPWKSLSPIGFPEAAFEAVEAPLVEAEAVISFSNSRTRFPKSATLIRVL